MNGSVLTRSQNVTNQPALAPAPAPSDITTRTATKPAASATKITASQSAKSKVPGRANSVSMAKSRVSTVPARSSTDGDKAGQALSTTLLGAAAGAAIAYGWSKYDDKQWEKQSADAKTEAEAHFAKKERSQRNGKSERPRSASLEPTRSVAKSRRYSLVEAPPSRHLQGIEAPPSRSGKSRYYDSTLIDGPERGRLYSMRTSEAGSTRSVRSQSAGRSTRAIEAPPSKLVETQDITQSVRGSRDSPPGRSSVRSRRDSAAVSNATGKSVKPTRTARSAKDEDVVVEFRSRRATERPQVDTFPASVPSRSKAVPASATARVRDTIKGMHHAYERANKLYDEVQDRGANDAFLPNSKAGSDSGGSRRVSTAHAPPLSSKAGSRASRRSVHNSAADIPLPASRVNSTAVAQSHMSGVRDKSNNPANTEVQRPESDIEDVLDDLETLVPDDSASCVGSSPPPSAPRYGPHPGRSRHLESGRGRDHGRGTYEYIVRPRVISETNESSNIRPGRRYGRRDSGISIPVRPKRRISFGKGKASTAYSAFLNLDRRQQHINST